MISRIHFAIQPAFCFPFRKTWIFPLLALLLVMPGAPAIVSAEQVPPQIPVGMDEQLGKILDLDYTFNDEYGKPVNLAGLVDRPTVLSFVYFNCPSLCSPLLSGLQEVLGRVDLQAGQDFNVVTISINKDETPALALEKKRNYLKGLSGKVTEEQWWWLTGDSTNIQEFTGEVGFHFKRNGNDFAHPAGLIVLSKSGKITRYLYGTNFNQFDLKMAILEAAQEKIGPSIATVLRLCFSYDPASQKYVFNLLQVTGTVVLLFGAIFLITLIIRTKKHKPTERYDDGE